MEKPTKEQWQKWYAHKSNKEIWIEEQEREKEENRDEENAETKTQINNAKWGKQ